MRFVQLFCIVFFITVSLFLPLPAFAVVDPLSLPNNKVGIHIISPTVDEASSAEALVNSHGGVWGYVTFVIAAKDRDVGKWQTFFNELRRRHLIPIVRIATKPVGDYWQIPGEEEHEAWAIFLNSLNWPTKNRYVVIYNEPNHAKEWGNRVDPNSYATVLANTIDALKRRSEDFFVLNAGFDASAPHQPPYFYDEEQFLFEMEKAIPGIFNKLDGWVSHSYPNPGFRGSPDDVDRGTIQTFAWELHILSELGLSKDLPVFITETGWKHSEGIHYDGSLPSPELVASFFRRAFHGAWEDGRIVAVTPFVLNYQDALFDHFSFKRLAKDKQSHEYYPHYQAVANVAKQKGLPLQENKANLVESKMSTTLIAGKEQTIPLTFKNVGQSIWNEGGRIRLASLEDSKELGIDEATISVDEKIEPGSVYTFHVKAKPRKRGNYNIAFNVFEGTYPFDNAPFVFSVEVQDPAILRSLIILAYDTLQQVLYQLGEKFS